MPDRRERLNAARLYLVCEEQPDEFLSAVLGAGVDIVQLRMKDAPDEAIIAAGRRFARAAAEHGALFILNDRPDLAAAAGADGVHVGQDDTPVADARALIGPNGIIGLSTHSPSQVDAAAGLDVDYIGVGPVHATPTKPGRPAVGSSSSATPPSTRLCRSSRSAASRRPTWMRSAPRGPSGSPSSGR